MSETPTYEPPGEARGPTGQDKVDGAGLRCLLFRTEGISSSLMLFSPKLVHY